MNPFQDVDISSLTILLADDEEHSFSSLRRALAGAGIRSLLEEARTGKALITLIDRRLKTDASTLPLFVVLDANLANPDAREVLQWIRGRSELDAVPVVVHADQASKDDLGWAFGLGADVALTKGYDEAALTYVYDRARQLRRGGLTREAAFAAAGEDSLENSAVRGGAVLYAGARETGAAV